MPKTYPGSPGEDHGLDDKRMLQLEKSEGVIRCMRELQQTLVGIEEIGISTHPEGSEDAIDKIMKVLSHVERVTSDHELILHEENGDAGNKGSNDGKSNRIKMNETWEEVIKLEAELNELRKQGFIG